MHRFARLRNITVLSLLIFANSLTLFGQTDSIYRLPAGTRIFLKLDAEINSGVSSVNDTFLTTVTKPVSVRGTIVLPVGTVLEGRVSKVTRAAVGGRAGKLDVVFETIKISRQTRHIDGVMTTEIVAPSTQALSFVSILSGLAVGSVIGGRDACLCHIRGCRRNGRHPANVVPTSPHSEDLRGADLSAFRSKWKNDQR